MAICWHPVWRQKTVTTEGEKMVLVSAAVMLTFIWDLALHLEVEKQFSYSEGSLNPLNAYHSNITTVWNGHLHNRSSSNKLINKTRQPRNRKENSCIWYKEFSNHCAISWLVIEGENVALWQLCHCVLLLLFQMSDKCQPLHWLAFC